MTRKIWHLIATYAIRSLLFLVLGAIAFALVVLTVLPRATHGAALDVLSGSMTPGIPVGSIVVDRPVDPGTLHVGDIATYQQAPGVHRLITHRIVAIDTSRTPTMFTFKGDANRGADINPVPATAIRGKVWFHVPYLGAIRDSLHTKGGLAGAAMLLLALYAIYTGASAARDRKRGQRQAVERIDGALPIDLIGGEAEFAVLMTVRRDAFEGLTATSVARALGGTLVEDAGEKFTVRVAEAENARTALELLDAVAV